LARTGAGSWPAVHRAENADQEGADFGSVIRHCPGEGPRIFQPRAPKRLRQGIFGGSTVTVEELMSRLVLVLLYIVLVAMAYWLVTDSDEGEAVIDLDDEEKNERPAAGPPG
jgi:hypothetical protein